MKKILLITTGGTISCVMDNGGLTPKLKAQDLLSHINYQCDFIDLEPIDSSVIKNEYRLNIVDAIWENRFKYDAFVITHGTDTMAYTAAFLESALKNFTKPIILTGSQLPILSDETDAIFNLKQSFLCAEESYSGVFIMSNGRLIEAAKVVKIDTKSFYAFDSIDKTYAKKTAEKTEFNPILKTINNNKISTLIITPTLTKNDILKYQDSDSIIVLSYGAGGMGDDHIEAFLNLHNQGIKLYIMSQCLYGQVDNIYAAHSAVAFFKILENVSLEYAISELMFEE